MEISGKVFIVTGAASGLGEGTARMLVANGARVVLADLQEERGQAVAAELGAWLAAPPADPRCPSWTMIRGPRRAPRSCPRRARRP